MNQRVKHALTGLAAACLAIATAMLVIVVTYPDLRIRTLLVEGPQFARSGGISILAAPLPEDCRGPTPLRVGDRVFEIGSRRVTNFVDFSRALFGLRNARLEPGARLHPGGDPTELRETSSLSLVEIDDGERFAHVRFWRDGESFPLTSWVKLRSIPLAGLLVSVIWFALQLLIVSVSAVAYWNMPGDRGARAFFVLCSLTLVALLGGSHWWVVTGSAWLSAPFAVAAILLPAVQLHFATLYPRPRAELLRHPRLVLTTIYLVPVLCATAMVALILAVWGLSWELVEAGPFARAWEQWQSLGVAPVLQGIRSLIYLYSGIAVAYFLATIWVFWQGTRQTRDVIERRQVSWMLAASLTAAVPLAYATWLAFVRRVDFALGGAQVPLFLASLAFMLAYALGVVRYRLMLVDRVIRQGLLYHSLSAAMMVVYSLVVATGCVVALRGELVPFNQMASVVVVVMLAIMLLDGVRDRLQRSIERRFFREKYRVSDTLLGMNRAVTGLMDRKTLAKQVLASCCAALGVEEGAVYLRPNVGEEFSLVVRRGSRMYPAKVSVGDDLLLLLQRGTSLQRVRAGQSSAQQVMRQLGAALVHGLDVDGEVLGLLAFGEKPAGLAYSSEEAAFLAAVGRTAGFALHFAKVHEDYGQLNASLGERERKLSEQQRRISLLERQLQAQAGSSTAPAAEEFRSAGMVGSSPAIREVLQTVRKVAVSDSSVLVRGESGTGKELLARSLHENSPRREAPLVSLHCGALSPTLLESELFGHVRGAFTDAREDKVGRFQLADGGTLFLDEIGDISRDVQIKLLRVLQQRNFEPVGSNRTVQVDVRVVAATHQNLEQLIRQGVFREDLYFRLNVISITLPPLRERRDDIVDLAIHFLAKANQRAGKSVLHIDDDALDVLLRHPWPGNIRELENVIERAVVLAEGDRITRSDLPRDTLTLRPGPRQVLETKPVVETRVVDVALAADDERAQLEAALAQAEGNKAEAARLLGLPRSTFYSRLKKYSID